MFNEAADNLVLASELLIKLMGENDLIQREVYIKLIKEAEHKGDDITRKLLNELNGSFITPFDREDIHQLISTMDDVVDYIHKSSTKTHFYKLPTFPEEFVKIAYRDRCDFNMTAMLFVANGKRNRGHISHGCIHCSVWR